MRNIWLAFLIEARLGGIYDGGHLPDTVEME